MFVRTAQTKAYLCVNICRCLPCFFRSRFSVSHLEAHFLFNSFSVLSSLVEKDAEAAVDFIAKLSDMYRYILENDEKSLAGALG